MRDGACDRERQEAIEIPASLIQTILIYAKNFNQKTKGEGRNDAG